MAEGLARTASERGWLHPASTVEGATQAPADGLPDHAFGQAQHTTKSISGKAAKAQTDPPPIFS
jgi:hypothetical protein